MLGVPIDDVLHVDLSDPKKKAVVLQQITTHKARVAAACGPGDVREIAADDLAPVYVVMKALEEMDTAD